LLAPRSIARYEAAVAGAADCGMKTSVSVGTVGGLMWVRRMFSARSSGLASVVGAVVETGILDRSDALLAGMNCASTFAAAAGGGVVVAVVAAASMGRHVPTAAAAAVVAVATSGILAENTGLVPVGSPEATTSIVLAAVVEWASSGTSLAGSNRLGYLKDIPIGSESAVGDLHSNAQPLPVVDRQCLDCYTICQAGMGLLDDTGRHVVPAERYLGTEAGCRNNLEREECCLPAVSAAAWEGLVCLWVYLSLERPGDRLCEPPHNRDQTPRTLSLRVLLR